MATPHPAALPPRPWESGERPSSEPSAERDLGVDRPSSRSSVSTVTPITGELLVPTDDAFHLFDLLRRSARALHAIADRLEGDDAAARQRARVAAAANVFYALGALSTRGLVLPRALPGAPSAADASMLLAPGEACRSLAEAIESLVAKMADGARPSPAEFARLVERFEECWDHITHEGEGPVSP